MLLTATDVRLLLVARQVLSFYLWFSAETTYTVNPKGLSLGCMQKWCHLPRPVQVRIAAIQTLRPVMHQNAHEMILEMVAFRDPNQIKIKAFYGDDLKVNFCGKMATDPHPQVSPHARIFASISKNIVNNLPIETF